MPIYEYECLQCGTRTEVLQRFSDPPLAICPQCGGEVKKLISSPAFQFKGSGFYATDYAGKKESSEKSEGKSEGGGKSEGADKAEKTEKADKPKEAAAGAKSSGSGGGSE